MANRVQPYARAFRTVTAGVPGVIDWQVPGSCDYSTFLIVINGMTPGAAVTVRVRVGQSTANHTVSVIAADGTYLQSIDLLAQPTGGYVVIDVAGNLLATGRIDVAMAGSYTAEAR